MSHLRFYHTILSHNKLAARDCAFRTLQLCHTNKNWPISSISACLCDKVAVCDMYSCTLQLCAR